MVSAVSRFGAAAGFGDRGDRAVDRLRDVERDQLRAMLDFIEPRACRSFQIFDIQSLFS
mgnify:CR=1 FL=1